MSQIDPGNLSLIEALDLAILIEEEAMERYEELADQLELHRTPGAAGFFRFMAGNEAKHRAQLSVRRTQLFKAAPRTVTRSMIFDVEAPEYDEARAFMSVRAALETALRAERKAKAFFEGALPGVSDPDVRTLFEELAQEEAEHEQSVQRELDRLPTEPTPNPDDYGDEPVGQ